VLADQQLNAYRERKIAARASAAAKSGGDTP
jgi:hypothetical protein